MKQRHYSNFNEAPRGVSSFPDTYPDPKRTRLTPAQSKALKAYNFALAQEDRYLGSVFVTPTGQREYEAKTAAAYAECKRLGLGVKEGL